MKGWRVKKGPNKPFWVTEKSLVVTMATVTPVGTDQHSLKGVVGADNGYMPLHINYNSIKLMFFNWPSGLSTKFGDGKERSGLP